MPNKRKLNMKNLKSIFLNFSFLILLFLLSDPCCGGYSERSDDWYRSTEGRQIADNILSWQSPQGSWPKNVNTERQPYLGDPNKIEGTFDNGATVGEMRFLARAFRATRLGEGRSGTGDQRYKQAFLKGLDHILKAQYPTGGWPQFYPPDKNYTRHITFNDGAMIRLMYLLREVAESNDSDFVDSQKAKAAKESVDRGIDCILKCQIRVNGKLTVWCAQHDEIDYSPRPGRSYELVSLSGSESVAILGILMSLDNPSPQIKEAIEAGVKWFDSVKITGIRQRWVNGDKVIVKDPNAPPLWARFYEIQTNRPIFSGRDGVKKYDMAEIEAERRNNYGWYGNWGQLVSDRYAKWKANSMGKQVAHPTIQNSNLFTIVVATDSTGQFTSVQAAVDAVSENNAKQVVISIKPGIYKEHIVVPHDRRFVSFIGENADKTVLTYNANAKTIGDDGKPIGTFRSASTVIAADYFTAENITFENSSGPGAQALAINISGDRAVFRKCRFLGWQDTILTQAGQHYFEQCYIAGHVDFIFGGATAFFQNCHIHCLADGYITAASTPENQPFGYVFSNCKITAEPTVKRIYLGRPWRPFANVTFIDTQMPQQIHPAGWHNWNDPNREKTARYAEFGSTGPGANPEKRVTWSKQLSKAETEVYTVENVLSGNDSWNPVDRERKR